MNAILVRPISLPHGFGEVPADTRIVIDPTRSIAFWNGLHFDVTPEEYIFEN